MYRALKALKTMKLLVAVFLSKCAGYSHTQIGSKCISAEVSSEWKMCRLQSTTLLHAANALPGKVQLLIRPDSLSTSRGRCRRGNLMDRPFFFFMKPFVHYELRPA